MLLKTKLFCYLLFFFFLIVSAKHIEKIWLPLHAGWEHFKILKYLEEREITFYPAQPSACYGNAYFLAYFTPVFHLIFALILSTSGQGLYCPLQSFSTLCVGYYFHVDEK